MRDRAFRYIGSISTGTLRPEDVIPELAWTLRAIRGHLPRQLARDVAWVDAHGYDDHTDPLQNPCACDTWDALIDAIQDCLPDYLYCGTLEGDGADIGIWPDHERIDEDRRTGDLPDVDAIPPGYRGLAVSVSDHGNLTLLRCYKNGTRREVWGCV